MSVTKYTKLNAKSIRFAGVNDVLSVDIRTMIDYWILKYVPASTSLCFMVKSICCNYKDVVGLFPISQNTGKKITNYSPKLYRVAHMFLDPKLVQYIFIYMSTQVFKMFSMSRYAVLQAGTYTISPSLHIPVHTVMPGTFNSWVILSWGLVSLQYTQLCRFTRPFNLNCASSDQMILVKISGFSIEYWRKISQNWRRRSGSSSLRVCSCTGRTGFNPI